MAKNASNTSGASGNASTASTASPIPASVVINGVQNLPVGKFYSTSTMVGKNGTVLYKCQYCGKWCGTPLAQQNLAGYVCASQYSKLGHTANTLQAHLLNFVVTSIPAKYVTLQAVNKACKKQGIPISALIRAFGGDKVLCSAILPAHSSIVPLYANRIGGTRYAHPVYLQQAGLQAISTGNFANIASAIAKTGVAIAPAQIALFTLLVAGKANGQNLLQAPVPPSK